MRIKIGDAWHSAEPGSAIAVELTAKDRENIALMAPNATRYAVSVDNDPDRLRAWIAAD